MTRGGHESMEGAGRSIEFASEPWPERRCQSRDADQDSSRRAKVVRGHLSELGNAGARAVVRLAGAHRLVGRQADVRGRIEVRLADLEVDNLSSFALELLVYPVLYAILKWNGDMRRGTRVPAAADLVDR